mgnify:CR=1 FL=1
MKNKNTLNIILIISAVALSSAYFIENVLGYKPCNLCLIERWPYIIAIILILTNLIISKLEKIILIKLSIIFAAATILSFYHVGIEQGFFEESAICVLKDTSDTITKEALLKQLQIPTISCKDVTFKIFGLSLTTYNMFLSLILTILLINIFKNYEKLKK